MKIATVTITRLGNKYLREYVEYYKNIGVDKMYFYDNNRLGEEKISDVLQDFVESGFVEIVPFGDAHGRVQEAAYQDFYDKHGNDYDWICVFDDDEYLTLNFCHDLKKFLSMFNGVNGVAFPMINFCDNDVIVNNKNTRLDVYTCVKDVTNPWAFSFYKTIVRGGLNVKYIAGKYENNAEEYMDSCHLPVVDGICYNNLVDCDGHPILGQYGTATAYMTINGFLKHIPTGCIDDYVNGKRKRGWPDELSPMQYDKKTMFAYEYFVKYNNHTDEKYKYFIEHME